MKAMKMSAPVGMVPDEPVSKFSELGGVTVITWCSSSIPPDRVDDVLLEQAAALREHADAIDVIVARSRAGLL